MNGIIYKFENLINNKKYIGRTIHPEGRYKSHVYNKHPTSLIDRAIKKYGIDSFTYDILCDNVPEEQLNILERKYIKEYDCLTPNGYNLTEGGEGTLGWVPSEETKNKIREATIEYNKNNENSFKGHKHSEETKNKIGNKTKEWYKTHKHPLLGKHHSEETKKKLSIAAHNRQPITEETKKKISNAVKGEKNGMYGKESAFKGHKHSEETKKRMTESQKNCSEETRRKRSNSLKGDKNPMYGKHWKLENGRRIYYT